MSCGDSRPLTTMRKSRVTRQSTVVLNLVAAYHDKHCNGAN